ncbi:MAG: DUF5985 family protein [Hyphomicrobium sp.]|uniref:DUF5985 family protein n=1 Tax=Hyphomicrobium sp. TaxID=82 RepID=UPI0013254DDE|nr:DUF5985 family protein [Hyphomicrobium sp.]KAB2939508.1 MAG: hypothetical protein F9K20_16635 [Hyphomicrobium sp.]MBZ0210105.1 DUF5985 family protein [Hyphomicrobium sp.]
MDLELYPMLMGAVAMASLVATLFFMRFWWQTHDPLFLFFAAAFALDSLTRIALGLSHPSDELEPLYYLVRLVMFGLIIAAIVHKNRPRRSR